MKKYQDSIPALRQVVERTHKSKAKFKEALHVRAMDEGKLVWEGKVFVFELLYETKAAGASKEQIEAWRLGRPAADAIKAAEARGQKIREALNKAHADHGQPLLKAKLAYAWSSQLRSGDKRKYHSVLHRGKVKSPVEAVRAAMGQEKRKA